MMKIAVPYVRDTVSVEVPDSRVLAVVEPNDLQARKPAEELVSEALTHPAGGKDFASFIEGAQDLLVIVNDQTRPTPTRKVIEAIAPLLEKTDTSFIIATGVHRGPTEEEYRHIFGDSLFEQYRYRIYAHDARIGCI